MSENTEQEKQSKSIFSRIGQASAVEKTALVLGGVVAVFVISLLVALIIGIAFGESEDVASTVAIVRDLFLILLALQGMLIGIAIIVMILQLATLINLVQNEVQPIVKNLQDATNTIKGTSEFLAENIATPVIESKAWMAGMSTFMRQAGGLRRAMKKPNDNPEGEPEEKAADEQP